MIPSGQVINGPDGQGYTTARDLHAHDVLTVGTFIPFGGAPECTDKQPIIGWLHAALLKLAVSTAP
jgi:hypothetical protein